MLGEALLQLAGIWAGEGAYPCAGGGPHIWSSGASAPGCACWRGMALTCGAGFCAGTSGWAGGLICEPAGSTPAHAAGGLDAGVKVQRTSAEGRQLLAWLRQEGRRACRRGGLRAGGAGRGGHAGDVHEAIRECMQKVADLLGAQLADLLAERAGGLAEQELPGARSHDAQGERLKRQC